MAIKAFKSKAPKEKLDPRTAQNSVKMKDRLDRATEAHRMIPQARPVPTTLYTCP